MSNGAFSFISNQMGLTPRNFHRRKSRREIASAREVGDLGKEVKSGDMEGERRPYY